MNKQYEQRDLVPDDWSVLPIAGITPQAIDTMGETRESIEEQGREMARNYLETGDLMQAAVETAVFWLGVKETQSDDLLDYRDLILEMTRKVKLEWASAIDTNIHPEDPPKTTTKQPRPPEEWKKDARPTRQMR